MPVGNFCWRRVEQQILGQFAFVFRNRGEPLDAFGVHDRQIESGLRAVIKENRIHHFARARRQPERNVRNSQHRAHVRNLLLDQPDPFDGFHRAADVILVARGAGKHQRIENDIFRMNAEFLGQQFVGALRDFQFSLARERLRLHGIFVDAADDQRRAVGARQRADALKFFFAIFQVDRIDDAFALAIGERQLDAARVGGVDHDRHFDFADQLLVERRNVVHFVAIGALQADVHDVRAAFHLPPRDFGGFFPLFGRHQILEQARADHVGALADDQRPRAFFGFDHFNPGINRAMIRLGRSPRLFPFGHLRDRANVLLGGSAASARRCSASRDRRIGRAARPASSAFPDTCLLRSADPHSDSRRRSAVSAIAACGCGRS